MNEILEYNAFFANSGSYKQFAVKKYPRKKLAILTCMDTRLVELLPAALGIKNGDVKMIKNAGGLILDPFDSSIRSLLIAVLELNVEEIIIIGHTDCGVKNITFHQMTDHLLERGITSEDIRKIAEQGLDLKRWFSGFENPESSVRNSATILRKHPLIPSDVQISGYVMDIITGRLMPVSE